MKIQYKNNKKTIYIVLIALLGVALAIGYLTFASRAGAWPFQTKQTTSGTSTSPSKSSNNAPTNSDDKNTNDTTYDTSKNTGGTTDAPADNTAKQSVSVGVTSADLIGDNVEVRANVTGVIEGTGTCTATLTAADGTKASGMSQGFVNATSTQCRTISIPSSSIKSGDYSVVVVYGSPTSSGTSPSLKVTF